MPVDFQEKLEDYLDFGVGFIWVVEPQSKSAVVYTPSTTQQPVRDGVLRTANPEIAVSLTDLF